MWSWWVWPENNTATFSAYAVPKTYVAGMSVEFLAENGEPGSLPSVVGEEEHNQRFSATVTVPLTDQITLSALLILPDGTRQTQLLDQFEGLYSDSLPQVDVHSELVWMEVEDGDLMLEKDDHERYVYIREIEPDAEQPAAAAANIQVGLFKNQKLVAWAEPCETPDSFHGFEEYDFYRLPELQLPVGEVSEKLGRGRHTTRHIELYALAPDTFVADTPGFSAFDTERMELVHKEQLQYAFPEFGPYLGHCQFPDCAHRKEPGCAVRKALADGQIGQTRYDSYERLYEMASQIKEWELK